MKTNNQKTYILAVILIAAISLGAVKWLNTNESLGSASMRDSINSRANMKSASDWQESSGEYREAFISEIPEDVLTEINGMKDNSNTPEEVLLTLPVRFHIITAELDGETLGDVPDSVIEDQVEILNTNFAGESGDGGYTDTGFQFSLESVDRLNLTEDDDNYDWFTTCYENYLEIARSLVTDPINSINIITCSPQSSTDGNPILGFATPPWKLDQSDKGNSIFIHYQTLPEQGTSWLVNYEGDNATHEMGHYLGLMHTFGAKDTCSITGSDFIDDTAMEKTAFTGGTCSSTRDTCPEDSGNDPIHNFMDYGYKNCMEEFTLNQTARMQKMTSKYRPGLWN